MSQHSATSVSQLQAITRRITSTPPNQLPSIAPQIAGAIWNCRGVLSTTYANSKHHASSVVHGFKLKLSTLLQDRTVQGRWAGIVLVKAAIEAGGIEVLAKCNAWVRSLLGILKKPDPPTTRILAVAVLTRIFMVTWDHANLVREITTPALTAFVPACLTNIENSRCSSRELQIVLEAFSVLLPRHPTIFRSNEAQLRKILVRILSSHPENDVHFAAAHKKVSGRLYNLLYQCTPKQGASGKWDEVSQATISAAHSTCDRVLRSFHESWQSSSGVQSSVPLHLRFTGEVTSEEQDAAGLDPWKGVYAGGERLCSLLDLIKAQLTAATSIDVSVRLGLVSDVLTRILSVKIPRQGGKETGSHNHQVAKEERDMLFSILPMIHASALQLALSILKRFRTAAVTCAPIFLELAVGILNAEQDDDHVRSLVYQLVAAVIETAGPSISRVDMLELDQVLKACCQDVLPSDSVSPPTSHLTSGSSSDIKQQLGVAGSGVPRTHPTDTAQVHDAARELLALALRRLDASCMSTKIRTQVDRLAVLTNDSDILFASVMNVAKRATSGRSEISLFPILARQFGNRLEVEALLRPRMPPTLSGRQHFAHDNHQEQDDGEDEDEEDEDEDESSHGIAEIAEEPDLTEGLPSGTGMAVAKDDGTTNHDTFRSGALPDDAGVQASTNGKRPAAETTEPATFSKRLRWSPVAKGPARDEDSLRGRGEDVQSVDALNAGTVGSVDASSINTHTASSTHVPGKDEEEGDGSDFDLPPLTAEPDTDEEEE